MKKLLALILSAVILFCFAACSETKTDDGKDDGTAAADTSGLEFEKRGDGYYVVGRGDHDSNELVIPAEYNGLPVIGIGEKAFYAQRDITKLTLPETVKVIERYAFWDCGKVEELILPEGLERIEENAFLGWGATTMSFPSTLKYIGVYGFSTNYKVETLVIGEGVEEIDELAFEGCDNLKSITLPKSLKKLGYKAFTQCEVLEKAVVNEGLTELAGTFLECGALKEVSLPSTLKKMDKYVFNCCWEVEKINFAGTVSEWEKIEKGEDWNEYLEKCTIYCSDGSFSAQ